jgi:hypothetical protein
MARVAPELVVTVGGDEMRSAPASPDGGRAASFPAPVVRGSSLASRVLRSLVLAALLVSTRVPPVSAEAPHDPPTAKAALGENEDTVPPDSPVAPSARVGKDGAIAAAAELVARIAGYSTRHPSAPGAVPNWPREAPTAGSPLLVRGYPDLKPGYYYVPLSTAGGRNAGFVTLSATTGDWQAYGARATTFPSVSREDAASLARREHGADVGPESLVAVSMPDRRVYWYSGAGEGASEIFISVSDARNVHTEASEMATGTWPATEPSRFGDHPDGAAGSGEEEPGSGEEERTRRAPRGRPDYHYPSAFDIEGIPYFYQMTEVSCGPATLQMVMSYWGPEVDQTEVAQAANMGVNGTRIEDMMRAGHFSAISTALQNPDLHGYNGRRFGYGAPSAYWSNPNEDEDPDFPYRHDDLKAMISDSRPVIVVTRYDPLSFSSHARVVKGYDDSTDVYIVHDPWYDGIYQGPDIHFNQELLDELWWKSRRWAGLVCPWDVTIDAPAVVERGVPFTVTAHVTYVGPGPLGAQDAVEAPTVTLLPSDSCQLAYGESETHSLGGWFADTGCEYDPVSWSLVADSLAQTGTLRFLARGLLHSSSTSYPSYSDSIGGPGAATLSIVEPEFITVDAGGGGSFADIQDALDYARSGELVRVLPGTYVGPRNRDLSFHGRDIRLRGVEGPRVTVLDCQGAGRGFALVEGVGAGALIEGITIRNGRAPDSAPSEAGGALYISDASPTIRNVRLESNSSPGSGGALCCIGDASPLLERVDFVNNAAESGDGGGLSCYEGAAPRLERCSFRGNDAGLCGGAVAAMSGSAPELVGCTLALNAAGQGGGVFCEGAHPLLTNTIVYGCAEGAGIACGRDAAPVLTSCCIYGNAGGDDLPENCISDGNIFADPLLCDPEHGELTLQGCSPCVGSGVSGADIGAFAARCACAAEQVAGGGLLLYVVGPSPFSDETAIGVEAPMQAGAVTLGIYNVRGQLVRTLVDGAVPFGGRQYIWRGEDDTGEAVGSGVYLVRCECGGIRRTGKVVIVR